MRISCRIDVLRNNAYYRSLEINGASPPQVNMNSRQNIKKQLRATFRDHGDLDFIRDRFVPYIIMDGAEYPLGKYIAAEAPTNRAIAQHRELWAYDLSYQLELSRIEERITVKAGTPYIDAIREQLILASVTDFLLEPDSAVIGEDREDWEPGETRMNIVNQLLSEINYESIWCDANGLLRATRKRRVTAENIDLWYKADENSILYSEDHQDIDLFDRPNVFRLTCENPEKEELMVAYGVNNDPASVVSTINTGMRILHTEKVDNIASQQELQIKADNMVFDNLLSSESVTLYTGPSPQHECFNILSIQKDDIDGIYQEVEWTLPLLGAAKMSHKVRRLLLA